MSSTSHQPDLVCLGAHHRGTIIRVEGPGNRCKKPPPRFAQRTDDVARLIVFDAPSAQRTEGTLQVLFGVLRSQSSGRGICPCGAERIVPRSALMALDAFRLHQPVGVIGIQIPLGSGVGIAYHRPQ